MAHNDRLLARLSVPVLRAMARRLGVDGADAMDREGLIAALSAEPSRRASAAGRSLRRLVARLPGTVLRAVPGWTPPAPITEPEGGAPKEGEADAGRGPGDETDNVAFETVSMADLLIRQGHVDKARAMLRRIVASRPDDGAAREKLDSLEAPDQRSRPVTRVVEPPAAAGQPPPEAHRQRVEEPVFRPYSEGPKEPIGLLDYEETPLGYRRVYAGLLPVDTTTVYGYWEVTHEAVEAMRERLGDPGARLTLRLASHHADAPAGGDIRDVEVSDYVGEYFFLGLRPGAGHRLAVGLRAASGKFEPLTHTAPRATPRGAAAGDTREVWLEVEPPGDGRGATPETIRILQRTDGPPEAALEARARRLGLAGLPEDVRARLMERFRGLLRSLWSRHPPSPGSPGYGS